MRPFFILSLRNRSFAGQVLAQQQLRRTFNPSVSGLIESSFAEVTVLAMTVVHVVDQGETVRYILESDAGLELQAVELGEVRFSAGARVHAGWSAADARIIQEESA